MKTLGKIEKVYLGNGGYQDAMFGFTFVLKTAEGGVTDFWGHWGSDPTEYAKWTKEERDKKLGECFIRVFELMKKAKKDDFAKLAGTPIELEVSGDYAGAKLESWRILEEVL